MLKVTRRILDLSREDVSVIWGRHSLDFTVILQMIDSFNIIYLSLTTCQRTWQAGGIQLQKKKIHVPCPRKGHAVPLRSLGRVGEKPTKGLSPLEE